MPPLSRFFVRASLLWISLALLGGFVGALGSSAPFSRPSPTLLHLLVVGGVTQLIFGVSYWMFPLTVEERSRGNERLGYVALVALNAGLALRFLTEPFELSGRAAPALYLLGGALQAAAAFCYTIVIWPRVRGPRGRDRHAPR